MPGRRGACAAAAAAGSSGNSSSSSSSSQAGGLQQGLADEEAVLQAAAALGEGSLLEQPPGEACACMYGRRCCTAHARCQICTKGPTHSSQPVSSQARCKPCGCPPVPPACLCTGSQVILRSAAAACPPLACAGQLPEQYLDLEEEDATTGGAGVPQEVSTRKAINMLLIR